MSVVITALVIAAVILFNVIFSALASTFMWQIDMTKEKIFTLSENCITLLDETFDRVTEERKEQGISAPLKVTFKFCNLEDNVMNVPAQRYILMTAKELAARYPEYINIEYINIWDNPTAVDPYKTSVHSTISSADVIIVSGTEHRIYTATDFFLTNTGASSPWAYLGEKRFASAILAVTQTESPVAAILMGHGEKFTDASLVDLLDTAGYQVEIVDDLVNNDLPENCRLVVCYNPTEDFMAADNVSDISEIQKLDDFLAGENHSLMVFMSPSSPVLPNLENYLALWGISFGRSLDTTANVLRPCTVKDVRNSLTGDGLTIVGQYETNGFGANFTKDMRSVKNPRRVVFKNAMPILISEEFGNTYDKTENGEYYSMGYKSLGNGYNRRVNHIFTAGSFSTLIADGTQVEKANANNPYGLMTVSMQYRATQEESFIDYYSGNEDAAFATQSSYVLACGSVEAATSAILSSATYGNNEVLLYAMNEMGKEPIPVSLPFAVFSQTEIESLTVKRANAYTVSLAIIPAALIFGVGIFVIVRRKHA